LREIFAKKRERKTLVAKKGSLVGAEKYFANGY